MVLEIGEEQNTMIPFLTQNPNLKNTNNPMCFAENERDFQILLSVWLLNHQNGTENACKAMQHSTCQEKVFNEHQPNF